MLLYIMLACLTLLPALLNAVCLCNASSFLPLTFSSAFCFHALSWILTHSLFISNITLRHAFNLLGFLILCSHRFLMKALCALEK